MAMHQDDVGDFHDPFFKKPGAGAVLSEGLWETMRIMCNRMCYTEFVTIRIVLRRERGESVKGVIGALSSV